MFYFKIISFANLLPILSCPLLPLGQLDSLAIKSISSALYQLFNHLSHNNIYLTEQQEQEKGKAKTKTKEEKKWHKKLNVVFNE